MIENFVQVRRNGHRTRIGEKIQGVSIVDQVNDPQYKIHHYEWTNGGQLYELLVDNVNTVQAAPLADGSGILVLQSEALFSSDNVIIIGADSNELLRVENPYAKFKDKLPDDSFWFYGMDIGPEEVALHIQVRRKLADNDQDTLPLYVAYYKPITWELIELNWVPWL